MNSNHKRCCSTATLLYVTVFAIAMAWLESAVVFYLRTMVNRIEPYQANPLPLAGGLGGVELVREAATLIMLLMVGWIAGSNLASRFAYSAIAFGVWDIFYYVFLRLITGWPHSLMDWDILFLLPLPWWGPVLAPLIIAMLMIAWGASVLTAPECPPSKVAQASCWAANLAGILLALYVFMADAIRVASGGQEALRGLLPEKFNWPLFAVACVLLAAPIARIWWAVATSNCKRSDVSLA